MGQYLRALYETSMPEERAGELVRKWVGLPLPAEEPSLQDIRNCAPEYLPDLGIFLPLWVSQLANADRSNRVVRTLFLEATAMSGGLDGLGEADTVGLSAPRLKPRQEYSTNTHSPCQEGKSKPCWSHGQRHI